MGDARAGSLSMGKWVLLGYTLEYHGVYIYLYVYIYYICIYKYNIKFHEVLGAGGTSEL